MVAFPFSMSLSRQTLLVGAMSSTSTVSPRQSIAISTSAQPTLVPPSMASSPVPTRKPSTSVVKPTCTPSTADFGLPLRAVAIRTRWLNEFCAVDRNVALGVNGTYYLPYQLFYSPEQLRRAYPEVDRWFAAKRTFDPLGLLTNKFYDKYGVS